jgi:hypothetical protein
MTMAYGTWVTELPSNSVHCHAWCCIYMYCFNLFFVWQFVLFSVLYNSEQCCSLSALLLCVLGRNFCRQKWSGIVGGYFSDIVRSSLFYHQGRVRLLPVSRAGYSSVHSCHLGRCSRSHWISYPFLIYRLNYTSQVRISSRVLIGAFEHGTIWRRVFPLCLVRGAGVRHLTLPPFPCVALLLALYHSFNLPHTTLAGEMRVSVFGAGFLLVLILSVKRHRVLGVATSYGMDDPAIKCRWGRDFLHHSRSAMGPT